MLLLFLATTALASSNQLWFDNTTSSLSAPDYAPAGWRGANPKPESGRFNARRYSESIVLNLKKYGGNLGHTLGFRGAGSGHDGSSGKANRRNGRPTTGSEDDAVTEARTRSKDVQAAISAIGQLPNRSEDITVGYSLLETRPVPIIRRVRTHQQLRRLPAIPVGVPRAGRQQAIQVRPPPEAAHEYQSFPALPDQGEDQ